MLQVAYSTVTKDGEVQADRGNSDSPAAATAHVLNVDDAVRRISMGDAIDPHANGASWQVLTTGEQNVHARVIDPAPASFATVASASFHALQEWEGYVLEVDESDFVARLVDMTAGASLEEEEAVIPRSELSVADDVRMCVGSIFRWVIGYERSSAGTKKRVSQIVLRDLPAITESDLRESEAWAREMVRSLNS